MISTSSIKDIEVKAKIYRKDGTIEDLGTISRITTKQSNFQRILAALAALTKFK